MPEYRFYSIKKDGHILGPPAVYDVPNDSDAIREAKQLLEERNIEIWQGARRVGSLAPE